MLGASRLTSTVPQIMKSYESSTATLRAILAHPSLQREKIDETMDAMASANADAKDIDEAIRMGTEMAQADAGIDDAGLIAHLSEATAGSLSGVGHSSAYEELATYSYVVTSHSVPQFIEHSPQACCPLPFRGQRRIERACRARR